MMAVEGGGGGIGGNKALRVTDWEREVRVGLTASSLDQFEERIRCKLDIDSELTLRVVLELDGTEIDDEDYFATLEPHTTLMILLQDQRWTPYKSNFILGLAVEGENGGCGGGGEGTSPVEDLVWRLHQDLSFFPWLTLPELERISKMDREEMKNVVPDPNFLEFLQTLCERYLQEKEKGVDGEPILNGGCNNKSGSGGVGGSGGGTTTNGHHPHPRCSTASILNDPLKLIRLYAKFNSMKAANANGFFSFSSCGSEESLASLHINPTPNTSINNQLHNKGNHTHNNPHPLNVNVNVVDHPTAGGGGGGGGGGSKQKH